MRRAIPAIVGTVAGLAALLGYKSGAPIKRSLAASPAGAPAAGTAAAAVTPAATTATTAAARETVAGSVIRTKFGDVQVQATVQGGHLLDVVALQLPFDRQKSQNISDRAAPMLRAEALAAQSARIDTISGATYTSNAYAQSLQAALDAARLTGG
jgi:uncharacterized protein with FMN-binding domain